MVEQVAQDSPTLVLNFIKRFIKANDGLSPTVREIMAGTTSSSGSVRWSLNKLVEAGLITYTPHLARTIRPK